MDPGTWHVQHSSRRLWHLKRNVHVIADAGVLEYTYQSETASEIQTHKEADWKIVETGRDGKLETWMIETEAGIQDAAGKKIIPICTSYQYIWTLPIYPIWYHLAAK